MGRSKQLLSKLARYVLAGALSAALVAQGLAGDMPACDTTSPHSSARLEQREVCRCKLGLGMCPCCQEKVGHSHGITNRSRGESACMLGCVPGFQPALTLDTAFFPNAATILATKYDFCFGSALLADQGPFIDADARPPQPIAHAPDLGRAPPGA